MNRITSYLAAAAAIGGLSAPLAAQNPYPYGYQQPAPQPYPGQPGYAYSQAYPQQAYGYGQQGYAQNPIGQIIDQLLGNRYNVTDRQAVSQCASAAMTQAAAQYGNGYNRGYGNNGYANNGYNRGYNGQMRVTSITDVQRRNNGLRVSGTMSSGERFHGQYANQAYAAGDISFRCNVDYRGAVTNVRIGRNMAYGR